MYRVKNTIRDRSKTLLHRTATGLVEEPVLAGRRLRLGEFIDIPDELYTRMKSTLDVWVSKGMVSVTKLDDAAAAFKDVLSMPSLTSQILPPVPVVEDKAKLAEEIVKAKEMAAATAEMASEAAVSETLTVTTEPAGAPVETPPTAPVVEERVDTSKKGPGKKKLF